MSAAEPFLALAGQAIAADRWDEARGAFADAVEAQADDLRGHGGLALCAIHDQRWEQAVTHGQTAAELPGASTEIHNNLGWALEQSGETEDALAAYGRAFQGDPTRPEPIHHLLRLGRIPVFGAPEEDATELGPLPLETLQRLELYEHLAGPIQQHGCDHGWPGLFQWAMERGAPYARLVCWLLQQGVECDCGVLQRLAPTDAHLATSILSGLILGERIMMGRMLGTAPGVVVLEPGQLVSDADLSPDAAGQPPLVLRMTPGADRAELLPQRGHAAMVLGLMTRILPTLGPDAALLMTVDPALHLGPRRLWMLSAISEVEILGEWAAVDGAPVDASLLPSEQPIEAARSPLALPGIDRDSLQAAVDEAGLKAAITVDELPGQLLIDADVVALHDEAWHAFLGRMSRWLPSGLSSRVQWREGGHDKVALLRRGKAPLITTLRPAWPAGMDDLELPLKPEVQLVGRALFEAPRSVRLMGGGE